MKKRIVAFLLLLVFVFTFSACSLHIINSDYPIVKDELESNGYTVKDYDGVYGSNNVEYMHATNCGDEIYVIYCSSRRVARSIYHYAKKMQKAMIAELEMEIKTLEYAIYKDDSAGSFTKGEYYKEYLEKKEALAKCKEYDFGRLANVVWYGTKQAIIDAT